MDRDRSRRSARRTLRNFHMLNLCHDAAGRFINDAIFKKTKSSSKAKQDVLFKANADLEKETSDGLWKAMGEFVNSQYGVLFTMSIYNSTAMQVCRQALIILTSANPDNKRPFRLCDCLTQQLR